MATSSTKIVDCEVCGASRAKYTCPKCEVRTCCLPCVFIHKQELNCNGIRDKTKYVPLKSFTDLDVLSDYRLLEEVGRSVDQLKRDPHRKCTRQSTLPMHLNRLKAAASKQNVNLQFMPRNFSRHKENTTFLKWKTNELFWRIEWIFPQAENVKWITERALETTRLGTLLEAVMDPVGSLENRSDTEALNLRIALRERLQFYIASGIQGVKVLLKAEKISKSKFYELDMTSTLRENLENKTIIEFPTLYVILKDHSDMFEIIDSDNEETHKDNEQYTGHIPRKRMRFNEEQQTKDTSMGVNYFFNSDFSESDEEKKPEQNWRNGSSLDIPEYNQLMKMEQ